MNEWLFIQENRILNADENVNQALQKVCFQKQKYTNKFLYAKFEYISIFPDFHLNYVTIYALH